jgi:[ribosomal protein S5]-alanine N-acetyltransferase
VIVELSSARLTLKPLSASQLALFLSDQATLRTDLKMPICQDIIDGNVARAINMKLARMAKVDTSLHEWYTYWLIIIRGVPVGAGLIGFKGYPDAEGKTEIGYGIGPAYRNQGYMTEALGLMSGWAFTHRECRVLTAKAVFNPASTRVLAKAGWQKMRQGETSSDWELHRDALPRGGQSSSTIRDHPL